jgi:hypothetical protein
MNADAPSYQVAFRAEPGCLVADVDGWIDGVDPIVELLLRSAEALRAARRGKLLVLDRTRGVVPPEPEMHRLLDALPNSALANARIAWVDVRGTAVGRIEVAEILGRERGYECRVFDNPQRARIWLDYGEA